MMQSERFIVFLKGNPRMLNKRVLASAVLSVSIAAPLVTPTAQAADAHLGCAQLQRGSDFDTRNIEGHLDEHLRRACKLSADQVKALSLDDLNKVAEELGYVNQAINIGLLPAYASAGEPAQASDDRAAGDSARTSLDNIYVHPVKAGDTAVTGQAWLHTPGQTRTVSAFFKAQATSGQTTVTNKHTDRPEIIDFTIQIPRPYVPKAGDVIIVGFDGDTSSQKHITVDAAPSLEEETPAPKPSPAPEAPAPHNPVPEKKPEDSTPDHGSEPQPKQPENGNKPGEGDKPEEGAKPDAGSKPGAGKKPDSQPQDPKLPEDATPEDKKPDNKAPENEQPEDKQPEQKTPEQKTPEKPGNPKTPTPKVPGDTKNPGIDKDGVQGSSSVGDLFKTLAAIGGVIGLITGVGKILFQGTNGLEFLQPLRGFLSQFNIRF